MRRVRLWFIRTGGVAGVYRFPVSAGLLPMDLENGSQPVFATNARLNLVTYTPTRRAQSRASVSCANDDSHAGGLTMATKCQPARYCWICGQEVLLEKCKTDEHGSAVHESCYVARMKMETESLHPSAKRNVQTET